MIKSRFFATFFKKEKRAVKTALFPLHSYVQPQQQQNTTISAMIMIQVQLSSKRWQRQLFIAVLREVKCRGRIALCGASTLHYYFMREDFFGAMCQTVSVGICASMVARSIRKVAASFLSVPSPSIKMAPYTSDRRT